MQIASLSKLQAAAMHSRPESMKCVAFKDVSMLQVYSLYVTDCDVSQRFVL